MKRFSATERPGTNRACWATMAMPTSWLREVVMCSMTSPRTLMVPESGGYRPVRMFISVDLPAPFLPTRAWISPSRTSKETPSRARTPGNVLMMLVISTTLPPLTLSIAAYPANRVSGGAPRCHAAPHPNGSLGSLR